MSNYDWVNNLKIGDKFSAWGHSSKFVVKEIYEEFVLGNFMSGKTPYFCVIDTKRKWVIDFATVIEGSMRFPHHWERLEHLERKEPYDISIVEKKDHDMFCAVEFTVLHDTDYLVKSLREMIQINEGDLISGGRPYYEADLKPVRKYSRKGERK